MMGKHSVHKSEHREINPAYTESQNPEFHDVKEIEAQRHESRRRQGTRGRRPAQQGGV